MSKLSFRARALDASKPMPIYLAEELPDLPDYSAINRAVPQMPSGMEKEEESEHHLQRAISGTGLIIPTPEVCEVTDLEFYERCYPPDYKMPKQHIHMQPLWEEQEAPEYDIDSEDERWLRQQRHAELTEWKFEQMMDKLEKSSGQTVVTLNEAKLLLERHDDLVTAVYDYWLNKRLNTQHPLILSVKTESRPGQSTNNPYLAFRRRTEKMQTRKNRKNDESSYEKMLKLRRDLARALTLLELVARRETAKRELVRLTGQLAERRYAAGDFANQLLPDPPPRPQYASVPIAASSFRAYSAPHYPPRAPPTPVDVPRQREKRSYKRPKKRLPAVGSVLGVRDPGPCSSSEEEAARAEPPPVDDGPFAFRRKPGCYYEMPTSTLCGDPLDPDRATKDALYDHELDDRNRYTLTSLREPYTRCVGFARRRACRGGRVALDRVRTPLDDLWPRLPFRFPDCGEYRRERDEEVELETKAHRQPKEMTRDYHTGGKYPWRHAFRQHLTRHPHLWTEQQNDLKPEMDMDMKHERPIKDEYDTVNGDSGVVCDSVRTIECSVRDSLNRVMRKRAWSGCSDGSYDSDESLQPVEREFEEFINEVNKKWLHFRPKTPPPSPPSPPPGEDEALPITPDTPLAVELRTQPSHELGAFTTSEFTLGALYDVSVDEREVGGALDSSGDDLLPENFTGLTEAQVESILSETDLKALAEVDLTRDDKRLPELLELVVDEKDPFLSRGQGFDGRAGPGCRKRKADARGSSTVQVLPLAKEPMYVETVRAPPPRPAPAPVKTEPAETPQQLPHGVQLKTVQTKHSPLKKHIITAQRREPADASQPQPQPQPQLQPQLQPQPQSQSQPQPQPQPQPLSQSQPHILTVAVSDSLKVRLQNHLLSSQAGVLVQNGPFPPVAVAVPVQQARDAGSSGASPAASVAGGTMSPRRVGAPLVHLAPASLAHSKLTLHHAPPSTAHLHHAQTHTPLVVAQSHTIHHVAPNKLKVVHAHPLTQSQRSQLLGGARGLAALPAVVSLAPLADAKLKPAPSRPQFIEIKAAQLAKGPHLVNVVRQQQPGKTTVSRLELNEPKKRQVVALDGAALKGNLATAARPHRVSLSLDGRQLVRAALPTVRTPHVSHQIQLKNRTLQVTTPIQRSEASSSIACIPASVASKGASIPPSVVANLLQKGVALPKGGQKVSLAAAGGVQTIAFAAHPLKRHQRLLAEPRHVPQSELSESVAPAAGASAAGAEGEGAANGAVRRRPADTPMEVT